MENTGTKAEEVLQETRPPERQRTCELIHARTNRFHPSVDGRSTQRSQSKERTSALRFLSPLCRFAA